MPFFWNAFILLSAYLLGSVPNAVWIGRVFFKTDVRNHGSGNAGSTNTLRVLGYKAGIPVLLLDILKGFLAVKMIHLTFYYIPETGQYINFQLLLGLAVIIGHIFPVFANFRGGKGVATLIGVILAIDPVSMLICLGVFLVTLIVTKYVSLSSMIAGLSFPVLVIVVFNTTTSSLVIFSMIVFVLLLFTHQKNIERLVRNEESKAHFLFRRR
ncbi:MAG: glycerol-3-phosphate 1-O-acyltransferase [Marinilabiliales bacterium]|nr:MAG: glycerol-3-phosphate 1-O-acyltransferase [Marinilabiliales bacterium]